MDANILIKRYVAIETPYIQPLAAWATRDLVALEQAVNAELQRRADGENREPYYTFVG